jgi:beta-lactamase superfamily II metal-dependent hydrolase
MKWSSCFLWLVLAQSLPGQQPGRPPSSASLSIRQLDVGQGDAALLTTPEGRRILIDAGQNARTVADILWNAGVDTIDLVVASHAHADHIGGMPAVFFGCVVRAYLDNGVPYTTATYGRTLSALEHEEGIQYLQATRRTITVGSVTLRLLPPSGVNSSQNDNSVGLLIEFGSFRALYTGDSERAELLSWLQTEHIPRVTLVKAAHHGSWNGVTEEWVRATSPAIVLISVGARNSYGHPSPIVEQMWSAAGARVFRTDVDGEIDVAADRDGNYTIQTSTERQTSSIQPAAHVHALTSSVDKR